MPGIENHRLTGPDASFRQTPNAGGTLRPRSVLLPRHAARHKDRPQDAGQSAKPRLMSSNATRRKPSA